MRNISIIFIVAALVVALTTSVDAKRASGRKSSRSSGKISASKERRQAGNSQSRKSITTKRSSRSSTGRSRSLTGSSRSSTGRSRSLTGSSRSSTGRSRSFTGRSRSSTSRSRSSTGRSRSFTGRSRSSTGRSVKSPSVEVRKSNGKGNVRKTVVKPRTITNKRRSSGKSPVQRGRSNNYSSVKRRPVVLPSLQRRPVRRPAMRPSLRRRPVRRPVILPSLRRQRVRRYYPAPYHRRAVVFLHNPFGSHFGFYFSFGNYRHYRYRPYRSCYSYWRRPHRVIYIYEPATPVVIEERIVVQPPKRVIIQPSSEYVSGQEKLIGELLFGETYQRTLAAEGLAQYRDIASIAALVDALVNDAESTVRQTAAESLGKIESPLAYEFLLRSAQAESDVNVKYASGAAAKQIKEVYGEKNLAVSDEFGPMNQGKAELGEYLEQLRFGSPHERTEAAKKLIDHKGTQATAGLIDALINDSEKDVRIEAAKTLGKTADAIVLPFLEAAREDGEEEVRQQADLATKEIHK